MSPAGHGEGLGRDERLGARPGAAPQGRSPAGPGRGLAPPRRGGTATTGCPAAPGALPLSGRLLFALAAGHRGQRGRGRCLPSTAPTTTTSGRSAGPGPGPNSPLPAGQGGGAYLCRAGSARGERRGERRSRARWAQLRWRRVMAPASAELAFISSASERRGAARRGAARLGLWAPPAGSAAERRRVALRGAGGGAGGAAMRGGRGPPCGGRDAGWCRLRRARSDRAVAAPCRLSLHAPRAVHSPAPPPAPLQRTPPLRARNGPGPPSAAPRSPPRTSVLLIYTPMGCPPPLHSLQPRADSQRAPPPHPVHPNRHWGASCPPRHTALGSPQCPLG